MTLKDCELWLAPYAPQILSILRIMVALLLFQHAFSKFFGFPAQMPTPAPFSLIWFAGVIELIAGTLLLLGLFTRIAAFILSRRARFRLFHWPCPEGLLSAD